ncbi:arylsulfatase B-like [Ctenocephalides felis]|uniref:arylsulfatase B-like n=1 Tax=Ctenocephalides felis TaxID=7515 RepID=UPI000E6E3ECF|nr:arylsulfatase B-like [Ctenocephalides felis]
MKDHTPLLYLLLILITSQFSAKCELLKKPHIIFILADDLGWNDVGFHGLSQIPTPNIDALAYSGISLQNYYVQTVCTPSRAALMTGKYPIHTGMQNSVLFGTEARGLPLSERLFPQYLKDLGYSNHMIGKWHLGHYKRVYTPLYRGFDSHLGFWTGHHDYYDHSAFERYKYGLDMRRGLDAAWDLHGQYTTDVFNKEAVKIVQNHNASKPLFLYMAHAAVHSANPYSPITAPDGVVDSFRSIENYQRRRFAAVLSKLDEAVGDLIDALSRKDMLKDCLVIFSTDNGGAPEVHDNAGSNWPLRGVKDTLFEGGVRGTGLIWSPLLKKQQRISQQKMHMTDWMPTLLSAIGANISLENIDGLDLWQALSEDEASPRTQILLNIDDVYRQAAVIDGKYKLLKGNTFLNQWGNWYGPAGRNESYNIQRVLNSKSGKALAKLGNTPTEEKIKELRNEADVKCVKPDIFTPCKILEGPCLFDLEADPCEYNNLAESEPELLHKMLKLLDKYNATAVPRGNLPDDPRSDPSLWDHTWTNFGDFVDLPTTAK